MSNYIRWKRLQMMGPIFSARKLRMETGMLIPDAIQILDKAGVTYKIQGTGDDTMFFIGWRD